MISKFYIILSILLVISSNIFSQTLSEKATIFLSSLSPELKEQAHYTFEDEEKFNMKYVPTKRKGPTFNDFNEEQAAVAMNLLKASMGEKGFGKATEIMKLEEVLYRIENNNPGRDSKDYHILIFGNPSENSFWGWKFEGHHLSLNFTNNRSKIIASTPSFMGTNPAIVNREGFEKKDVLNNERILGFKLINSLDSKQLKVARFSDEAPAEIITGTARKVENIEPRGISYQDLNDNQQEILMNLLNTYINNYELGFAETLRAKIKQAGIQNLTFAWAGGTEIGTAHYYRIQGPMLLIEYDNIQNNANHIHTIVRDLTNDYAEDILKEHYKHEH